MGIEEWTTLHHSIRERNPIIKKTLAAALSAGLIIGTIASWNSYKTNGVEAREVYKTEKILQRDLNSFFK